MNQLTTAKRAQIAAALVEGNSIRAIVRMTGAAKNTVIKLLVDLGKACAAYQDAAMRDLPCKRLQCDEIWCFVYAKSKNVPESMACDPSVGDVWTWTAIDADTKLIPSWMLGGRDAGTGEMFMRGLASRLVNRVQLTTDGHTAHLSAVEGAFGDDIDYAMLIKLYGGDSNPRKPETDYSPGECNGSRQIAITGEPKAEYVSTSYAERQNLRMRMSMRRYARLTNAFSKKVENLAHAVAFHFMYYNYCRKHRSINMTPAQAGGLADHRWSIEEILALLD